MLIPEYKLKEYEFHVKEISIEFLKCDPNCIEIVLVSRLVWRNVVFRVIDHSSNKDIAYCVKLFTCDQSSKSRILTELSLSKSRVLRSKGITIPPVLYVHYCLYDEIEAIVFRPWIEGLSFMSRLSKDPELALGSDLSIVLKQLQTLRSHTSEEQLMCGDGSCIVKILDPQQRLISFFGISECSMISSLYNQLPQFHNTLDQFWQFYQSNSYIDNLEPQLTHGDCSAHEWIFTNSGLTWLDWESAAFQSPIVDIAGLYHSVGQNLITKPELRDKWRSVILASYKNVSTQLFGYYFAQRVLSTSTLCAKDMKSEVLRWGFEEAIYLMNNSYKINE